MALTPDFDTYTVEHDITSVAAARGHIELHWSDGRVSRYHHIWLRDNCPCPTCVHQGTREQMFELVSVPPDVQPISIAVAPDGALVATWSDDGHVSAFHPGWLRANAYDDESRAERVRRRIVSRSCAVGDVHVMSVMIRSRLRS